MSAQAAEAEPVKLPWEAVEEAEHAAIAAVRSDDVAAIAAAMDRLGEAYERCGKVGTMMFGAAIRFGSLELQRQILGMVGTPWNEAFDKAVRAIDRTDWALARVDAQEQRIRWLEEQLARVTPGVGEPLRKREYASQTR